MLNDFQNLNFQMWQMFDRICKENNIKYYFAYGSAIGAIRENGFIPWDDDIDIMILRSEYNKLRQILKGKLDSRYKLVEPVDYDPYFYDALSRLIDLNIPLRKENEHDKIYHNYNNKMSIDIFVLDNAPNSKFFQHIMKFKLRLLYCMARSKRYNSSQLTGSLHYNKIKKLLVDLCYILGKPFSKKWLLTRFERCLRKYENTETNNVITGCAPSMYIGFFEKRLFDKTVFFPFQGSLAPIPVGYDSILKQIYGNYMQPVNDKTKHKEHVDDLWRE